jgi:hypothetical protein
MGMISISERWFGKLNQNEFGHFLRLYFREQWHLHQQILHI